MESLTIHDGAEESLINGFTRFIIPLDDCSARWLKDSEYSEELYKDCLEYLLLEMNSLEIGDDFFLQEDFSIMLLDDPEETYIINSRFTEVVYRLDHEDKDVGYIWENKNKMTEEQSRYKNTVTDVCVVRTDDLKLEEVFTSDELDYFKTISPKQTDFEENRVKEGFEEYLKANNISIKNKETVILYTVKTKIKI